MVSGNESKILILASEAYFRIAILTTLEDYSDTELAPSGDKIPTYHRNYFGA